MLDTHDVHAVAGLVQPVFHAFPVPENLAVLGDVKVGIPNTFMHDTGMREALLFDGISGYIKEKVVGIGLLFGAFVLQPCIRDGLRKHLGAHARWLFPKQIVGEDVEHARLVDALAGVLAEQHIAPIEQIVDVGHHGGAAVGNAAQRGNGVGIERIVEIRLDLLQPVVRHQGIEPGQLFDDLERFFAVACHDNSVALAGQGILDHVADTGLVVDDQDGRHTGHAS